MIEPRPLFSRDINQAWKFISFNIMPSALTQKNLIVETEVNCFNGRKRSDYYLYKNAKILRLHTWIMPGWSRTLFPGHGVPSCMVHPSSGTFWAFATKALILTLNSSYSLWKEHQTQFVRMDTHILLALYLRIAYQLYTFIALRSFTNEAKTLSFR